MESARKPFRLGDLLASLLLPRPVSLVRYAFAISFLCISIGFIVGIFSVHRVSNPAVAVLVATSGLAAGLPVLFLASRLIPKSAYSSSSVSKAVLSACAPYFVAGIVYGALALVVRQQTGFNSYSLYAWHYVSVILACGVIWTGVGMLVNRIVEREEEASIYLQSLEEKVKELNSSRRRIVSGEERVRREVAEKLHGPIQTRLFMLWKRLSEAAESTETTSAETKQLMAEVSGELDSLLKNDLRQVCRELPPSIINLGLPAAIRSICDQVSGATQFDFAISEDVLALENPANPQLPYDVRLALYRFVQEAVSNVVKHANAPKTKISIRQTAKGISVSVEDNGVGFAPGTMRPGLGMATIKDHVAAQDGTLDIKSRPGKGTRLLAYIPLNQ